MRTFDELAKQPEVVWKLLELADERACTVHGGKGFSEREVRQLGSVVAWRDSKVNEQRYSGKPSAVNLEIAKTRAAADKRALAVVDGTTPEWGLRPAADEPADAEGHSAMLDAILKAGDVKKLKAYRDRYRDAGVLHTSMTDGAPRQSAFPVWNGSRVLQRVASESDDPKLVKMLLEDKAALAGRAGEAMLHYSIGNAMQTKRAKVLALLLPLVKKHVDEEHGSDSLLSQAVRLADTKAVAALLKLGADPNKVMSPRRGDKFPDDGNGPMVNAVRAGNVDILKLLVEAGGNPVGATYVDRPLIALAKDLKNKKVIAYLASCKPRGATEAARSPRRDRSGTGASR